MTALDDALALLAREEPGPVLIRRDGVPVRVVAANTTGRRSELTAATLAIVRRFAGSGFPVKVEVFGGVSYVSALLPSGGAVLVTCDGFADEWSLPCP